MTLLGSARDEAQALKHLLGLREVADQEAQGQGRNFFMSVGTATIWSRRSRSGCR